MALSPFFSFKAYTLIISKEPTLGNPDLNKFDLCYYYGTCKNLEFFKITITYSNIKEKWKTSKLARLLFFKEIKVRY